MNAPDIRKNWKAPATPLPDLTWNNDGYNLA